MVRSVFSWFITAMAIAFWIFRLVVALMATFKVDYLIKPIDINIEIILLFLALPCLILILKRNILGGIAYFGLYGWYFGTELWNIVQNVLINNMETITSAIIIDALVAIVAILISIANLFDIVFPC